MENQQVVIPPNSSPELINITNQFNLRLQELQQQLAQIQGTDGQSSVIKSDLDLQGKQIVNVGVSSSMDGTVTRRSMRAKGLYRSRGQRTAQLNNVVIQGASINPATTPNQPATLAQVQATLSPTPAATVTDETTYGLAPATGASTNYAREDHTHGSPAAPVIPSEVAESDYSGTSTIVGWASFTTKKIGVKKIGKQVFVRFDLSGTSNATNITFTLADANNAIVASRVLCKVTDNGITPTAPGYAQLPASSSTVTVYFDLASTGWTNSGTKTIQGEFFYETT